MPNTKYVVTVLRCKNFAYDIVYLPIIYSSKTDAQSALANFLNEALKAFAETDHDGDVSEYSIVDNVLSYRGFELMKGKILEVKEEEPEETLVDVLMKKYGENHRYIARGFLQNAYNAFCHHFSIDKDETEYGCGSLEKLARILGKDFRDSDLLFLIAESFERIFDPEYSLALNAWQDAIIDVVGEEKYEAAFEEDD